MEMTMSEITDVAKAARAALRRAFPASKISVTSSDSINVRWTDDGPSLEQVKETLLKAGCAEAYTAYNGLNQRLTHLLRRSLATHQRKFREIPVLTHRRTPSPRSRWVK
jgi:hypothetical protein